MKNTFLFILFISTIVALFAFAFSFSQEQKLDGKQVFIDNKCTMCHSVTSVEITSKKENAVDLSNIGSDMKAELLKSYLMKEAKINEKEHKLKFKGTEEELNALIDWLMTLKIESKD
ncbi:MAG: c-type cytochrome [Ignavibacteriaceae bacterium]